MTKGQRRMKNSNLIKGYVLVILSAFLFGCVPLIARHIYAAGINRESVVLLRNFLALPVLALLTWKESRSFKIPVKTVPMIAAIALTGCCITPLLLYGSYQYIATGTATVFHFIYPAVVVLIGLLFLRKKFGAKTLVAVLICVVGICLFYNPTEPLDWTGCIMALISGVTYAVYVVLLSVFRSKEISGFKLCFYISILCSAVMLAVCLLTDKLTMPTNLTGWLLSILLALAVNVGAAVMFQQGTFYIGGERASVLSTVEPLTGVVVGMLAFDETVTLFTGIGSALVVVACILIAVDDMKKKKA